MPKLPRALSSAESNAGAPIRSDGGVFCTDFQSCLQRCSLSALQVDNDCGTHSAAQGSQVCHCGEAEGRRGALSAKREEVPLGCNLGRQLRFRRGFPVIHPGTARLPRRFAPRNDNSGASTILSATCTNCQFSAGRGMPLPYSARLDASRNYPLSIFHLHHAAPTTTALIRIGGGGHFLYICLTGARTSCSCGAGGGPAPP